MHTSQHRGNPFLGVILSKEVPRVKAACLPHLFPVPAFRKPDPHQHGQRVLDVQHEGTGGSGGFRYGSLAAGRSQPFALLPATSPGAGREPSIHCLRTRSVYDCKINKFRRKDKQKARFLFQNDSNNYVRLKPTWKQEIVSEIQHLAFQ